VLKDLGITCVINATIEMPTVAYQKQECMQIAVEDTICNYYKSSSSFSCEDRLSRFCTGQVGWATLSGPLPSVHI
jgi:hypothetical protein